MARVSINEAELRQAWHKYETSERIADHYGCHFNTILNRSRKYGIDMKLGPKSRACARKSSVSRFFATYDGALPNTIGEIAEISGCSKDAIRNYSYRRRKEAKTLLGRQPWRHTGAPVLWEDIKGSRIPDHAFDVVRAILSQYGSIKFEVRLKTGSVHVFKMTASQFKRLYQS